MNKLRSNEFMRDFCGRLWSKGVRKINPGHDPGYAGLRAVALCLEEMTSDVNKEDLAWEVRVSLFRANPWSGLYSEFEYWLASNPAIVGKFVWGEGTTFTLSVIYTTDTLRSHDPQVTKLSEELAAIFVQGYCEAGGRVEAETR